MGIEGAGQPHLSWRELVCLGQEKLLKPAGSEEGLSRRLGEWLRREDGYRGSHGVGKGWPHPKE